MAHHDCSTTSGFHANPKKKLERGVLTMVYVEIEFCWQAETTASTECNVSRVAVGPRGIVYQPDDSRDSPVLLEMPHVHD